VGGRVRGPPGKGTDSSQTQTTYRDGPPRNTRHEAERAGFRFGGAEHNMGAQARDERIVELLEPVLAEAGLDLEGITVTPAGKRQIGRAHVDSDNGVDLETVGEVSQEVSQTLDTS